MMMFFTSHYIRWILGIIIPIIAFVFSCWAFFLILPSSFFLAAIYVGLINYLAYTVFRLSRNVSKNMQEEKIGTTIRYIAALIGLSIVLAILINFSPKGYLFSQPMIVLVSFSGAFTFIELAKAKKLLASGKRLLYNTIVLGFVVVILFIRLLILLFAS